MSHQRIIASQLAVVCTACFVGATSAWGADPVFSGPQVGEKLPPLEVVLAYGSEAGKTVDLADAAEDTPALLIIVNGANRPAARLTRALLNYSEMHKDKLHAAMAYLDADRPAAEKYLKQAISWWGSGMPVGVSVDGAEGPGSYGLNRNVNVTVLLGEKQRVVGNWAVVQPSTGDAAKILAEVVKRTSTERPSISALTFLSAPTRKPPMSRWTAAPANVEFRRLICTLLDAKDAQGAQQAATAIDRFVAEHEERKAVLQRVATMLLGRGYTRITGVPAVRHLRRWKEMTGEKP